MQQSLKSPEKKKMEVMYIVIDFVISTQDSKPGMGKEWPAENILIYN